MKSPIVLVRRDTVTAAIAALRAVGNVETAHGLEALAEESDEAAAFRLAAQNYAVDGDLEFDSEAVVSEGAEDGAYVMGWKWISREEANLPAIPEPTFQNETSP